MKLKLSTKLLGIALPAATLITLVALLVLGGVAQVGQMPDLVAYALELAPRTMYALAIGGSAALSMHVTGMNLDNTYRVDLVHDAATGHFGAMVVLAGETVAWLAWTILWAVVYLHS